MDTQPIQQARAATAGEIDLQPFCSTDPTRLGLLRPFSYGEWTYATDGRLIVRVPRHLHTAGPLRAPTQQNVEEMFRMFPHEAEPVGLGELPDVLRTERECFWCSDPGEDTAQCDECDGRGKLFYSVPVGVGDMCFAAHFLARIKVLPELRFHLPLQHQGNPMHAATFYFSGGSGLLMPMRR